MNAIPQIQPEQLHNRLHAGETLCIIDVREDHEVAQGSIAGAMHIRLSELPHQLDIIPTSGDIVVICRSGYRSELACEYLLTQGIDRCLNLSGGMLKWCLDYDISFSLNAHLT